MVAAWSPMLHVNENWVVANTRYMPASKCQGGFVFRGINLPPAYLLFMLNVTLGLNLSARIVTEV